MIKRVLIAIIFIPLLIFIMYQGGNLLAGMILVLACLGMIEYLVAQQVKIFLPVFWLPLTAVIIMIFLSIFLGPKWGAGIFIIYFMTQGMLISFAREDPGESFALNAALVWGVAYLGFLYPFVYLIRQISQGSGGDWLLFLFGTIWLSDSLAMWVGKAIGCHKLSPIVSPGKTIEGFIAGLFGGIFVAVIMSFWRLHIIPFPILLGAGLLVSLTGQLGDLAESLWKRSLGIKDSSKIIPGHGGVLDRFDSLLFAAPFLYAALRFIIYN
ncbi:putative Phosphatidate cytidylyltransferase [Candidatus Zixiibacteriota bacterium]|nr:putative Phosphatidate cytidylyltransferase [candidate division Zixibacteria bacterium]